MIVTTVLEAVWQIMQDEDDPHEFYPEKKLIKWVNEAVDQIRQRRPDSLISEDGLTIELITPVAEGADTISIADRWFSAIVEWVVFRTFQTDAEDEGDQKQAASHQNNYENYILR